MHKKAAIPRTPKGLSERAGDLWRQVTREYILAESQLALLAVALESLTRADLAREQIDREGMTTMDRFEQIRAHPLLAVESQARSLFSQIWRKLDLHLPGGDES